MKHLIFLISLFICNHILAQAPQAFSYQGIARDVSGTPLANTNVSLRLTIRENGTPGLEVYKEEHHVTTNKLGIFNVEVGHGVTIAGDFASIQWGGNQHFIQVDIDPAGGQNFIPMGVAQLLSVPYALYAGNGSQWSENPFGLHYNSGNVGIGDASPLNKLSILSNEDNEDGRFFLSLHNPSTSNRSLVSLKLSAGSNNSQTDLTHQSFTYDFDGDKYTDFGQLRSTGRGLILRSDANNSVIKFLVGNIGGLNFIERMRITDDGNVGIGTENPLNRLSLVNNVDNGEGRNLISLNNTSVSNRSIAALKITAGNSGSVTDLTHLASSYDYDGDTYTDFGQLRSNGSGLILRSDNNNSVIKFLVGNVGGLTFPERMRINADGNVGIGTEDPSARLQISNGDVYIENISNGVIMKSPNGSCWRVTVQNDGTLKTTATTCPN